MGRFKLTVGKPADGTTTATATAVRVKAHAADRLYIVGAYHTLIDGRSPIATAFVTIGGAAQSQKQIEIRLDPIHRDVQSLYYNIVQDIFIARINDDFVNKSLIPSAELAERPIEGYTASAVGNPKVAVRDVVYDAVNISYSCTIAEYGKAEDRVTRLLVDPSTIPELKARLFEDAKRVNRMFVETLSIKIGFSGGPVLTAPLNADAASQRILGVVVAGTQDVAPGRFAIVCPSAELRRLIDDYESLSAAPLPRDSTYAGVLANEEYARIDWSDAKAKEKYGSPYRLSQYSPSDELTIDHKTITNEEFTYADKADFVEKKNKSYYDLLSRPTQMRIVFNHCDFVDVDFRDSLLAYVTFRNCRFFGATTFQNCSASGSSFQNCGFSERPQLPCAFLFGYNSLEDINNYQLESVPRQFDKKDVDPFGVLGADNGPAVSPRRLVPVPSTSQQSIDSGVASKRPPAADGRGLDVDGLAADFVGCQLSNAEWLEKAQKLKVYQRKLLDYVNYKIDTGSGNRFIRRAPDPDRSRYALTVAEVTLEIARCELRTIDEPGKATGLKNVNFSLKMANNVLEALDVASFDADEQRVYFSINALHRRLMVDWLEVVTNAAVGASDEGATPEKLGGIGSCPDASSTPQYTGCNFRQRVFFRRSR